MALSNDEIQIEQKSLRSDSDSILEPSSPDVPSNLSVSAWLAGAGQEYRHHEELEDEEPEEDQRSPSELDAHVLDYVRTQPLPTVAAIPVLCMASETTLPAVMTSALYHRHALHIDEPVIGVSFSRYDTSLCFYFGWTDPVVAPGDILVSDY